MKNIGAKIIATALILGAPMMAFAATVQVQPSLINSHGGTATGADLRVCIQQGSWSDCAADMPTFTLPGAGTYQVTFSPPAGYTAEPNYHCPAGTTYDYKQQAEVCVGQPDTTNTCSGDIGADENKVCHVRYKDGAPIAPPTQATPGPTGSGGGNTAPQPVSVPIPTGIPTPVEPIASPEATATPEVITKTIIVHEYTPVPATTTIESPTTTQQIEDLQSRVSLLEQVVRVLQDLIGKVLNFLGL